MRPKGGGEERDGARLFFGSLTHQDFTVRLTDSATGEFRTYVSPGQFCGGADTTAF